ncbi:lysoplasmalogenase [Streptomyces sp. MST-110588]|uniref:lysoplasmalogenase n=1 Tax=Streptomyces sp. MST-110588 TaxID=2833628 RepID=UPI001F5C6A81|nr:lysoplasmalogenase [Streptomyces sp. MST-110588]
MLAVTHLAALLTRAVPLEHLTKPALMPVLAACVLARGAPRQLAAALLFGCGGDVLLQIGGDVPFLLGMGSFAAGHLCYLRLFTRRGRFPGRRPALTATAAALVYAAGWLAVVALLWPGLAADMKGPVAGYSLLLTGTAFQAVRLGPRAALGGLLFLLSDTLIAGGIARWPQPPVPQFWIMLTYIAAQYALADGVRRAYAAGPGPAHRTTARRTYRKARTTV